MAFALACPHCGTESAADLPPRRGADVERETLKGTRVDCPRCGDVFECYFY